MINSINKGKNFEREVAHILTKHFGVPFKRVPMSGAFSTTQNTKNPVFKGDVFTEDEKFNKKYNVVIECKRINKLPKHNFNNIKSRYDFLNKRLAKGWISQCSREARPKNFWLIFRQDYDEPFIIRGEPIKRTYNIAYLISTPELLKVFLMEMKRRQRAFRRRAFAYAIRRKTYKPK